MSRAHYTSPCSSTTSRESMLPFPGTPGASLALYRERAADALQSLTVRTAAAFFLLGLINNVLYVIILSAAADLVGPSIPKGVVLLADVLPGFAVKLIGPYFVHLIPYGSRVLIIASLSALGMLLIAFSSSAKDAMPIAVKIVGIMLASTASGGGELSFLGLTHFYEVNSLAAWGAGTGAAGLVGAGAYSIATTSIGFSSQTTLLAFSFLPALMLVGYFLILPSKPTEHPTAAENASDEHEEEQQGLLSTSTTRSESLFQQVRTRLRRAEKLFVPYMLPLLLVYVAEYTINQGVSPTLLFPPGKTPFERFRDFYPAYNAIYQVGVFISRSSIAFVRIRSGLYLPSMLQLLNLIILTMQALFGFIPTVYVVFAIIFWEGLLGGLVYVNTFADITDQVPSEEREFSLSATTVSDSAGICLAAFFSMGLETWLCRWQVAHGKDWCRSDR